MQELLELPRLVLQTHIDGMSMFLHSLATPSYNLARLRACFRYRRICQERVQVNVTITAPTQSCLVCGAHRHGQAKGEIWGMAYLFH
jgi:hypothetical protein